MNTKPSQLDCPGSIPAIRRLMAKGWVAPDDADIMEQQVRRELPWEKWINRGLLSLSSLLILAGIGYFFAYNWDHLTNNSKLLLASGAVLASLIGGTFAGLEKFAGKLLLLAASALVGVYIAVFGQIYQTGADNYELFTGWALLILPWVLLGRFVPLWLFWLAVVNLAVAFYLPLAVPASWMGDFRLFRIETVSLLLVNAIALGLREILEWRKTEWLDHGWSIPILVLAIVGAGSVATMGEIIRSWDHSNNAGGIAIALLVYTGVTLGLGWYFSQLRYSLPALAIVTLGACTTTTVLAVRIFVNGNASDVAGIWLILGMIVLAIFGSGVWFLRAQRLAHLEGEKK